MTRVILILGFMFSSNLALARALPLSETDPGPTVRSRNSPDHVLSVISDLKVDIKKAALAFGLDPIHVAAAIAGEHAMFVSSLDSLQTYLASRSNFLTTWLSRHDQLAEELFELINSPAYQSCQDKRSSYSFWFCVSSKWQNQNGRNFASYFFNPNGVGATFGVGQMSPLRALMVSDMVAQAGLPRLNFRTDGDITSTYEAILNPKTVVYYIAASISYSIKAYDDAGWDISENPAITATLYNTGGEYSRAKKRANGSEPKPNDLGRWVLQNIDSIRSALQ